MKLDGRVSNALMQQCLGDDESTRVPHLILEGHKWFYTAHFIVYAMDVGEEN